MTGNDLAAAERRAFRSVVDTGLWDVMLASVVAMFAIAPLLSSRLGDFWSSAVFVPVWGATYLVLRMIGERVVVPRVGVVRFGARRQSRLQKFSVALAIVNVAAFALGALFAARAEAPQMWAFPILFSLIVLAVSSLAAAALNIPRLFLYGAMIAVAPAIGEWLFRNGYAAHHGYPVVYGTTAIGIAAIGLTKLTLLLQKHPDVVEQASPVGHHD